MSTFTLAYVLANDYVPRDVYHVVPLRHIGCSCITLLDVLESMTAEHHYCGKYNPSVVTHCFADNVDAFAVGRAHQHHEPHGRQFGGGRILQLGTDTPGDEDAT